MIDDMKSVETGLYQATEMAFEYSNRAAGTVIPVRCSGSNCSDCSGEDVDFVLESVSGTAATKTNERPLRYWPNDRSHQSAVVDLIDMVDVLAAAFPLHCIRMPGWVTMTRIASFGSFRSRSTYR